MNRTSFLRQPQLLLIATFLLPACGGPEFWVPDPDGEHADFPTSFRIEKICSVKVSGVGTISVDDEYIPRVVWCEIQGEPRHQALLRAQAIAARTFMYSKLSQGFSSMRNGTEDQVYRLKRCSGTIPEEYRAAARDTAGVVMTRSDGRLHAGYYRAGTHYRCQKYSYSCFGEPCLGQREASTCAAEGYGTQQILDLFYNEPLLERAAGSCSAQSAVGENCYQSGIRGTCQSTGSSCAGSFVSGLCNGPADIQCCLPPEDVIAPTWGACVYGTEQGTCQSTNSPCSGSFMAGLCAGPSDVQCCLPSWGPCSYASVSGTCQATSNSCAGSYMAGLCPGPSDIQCCLPPGLGSCSYGGRPGTCQQTGTSCGGVYVQGSCPGWPSDVQCCLP